VFIAEEVKDAARRLDEAPDQLLGDKERSWRRLLGPGQRHPQSRTPRPPGTTRPRVLLRLLVLKAHAQLSYAVVLDVK